MSKENPVKTLNPEVARKIAAGEVIDRPNAIIRELMDNAIDSGADSITVEINEGGIEKTRIVDNGCGMTKEDLSSCARPHATSKISSETDLLNLTTLGFRGEALSSIAAVCRLSIISGGYKMRASITEDHIIEPATPLEGTIVQAEGLFENFPARRQFLKRPASETLMCKNTFVEKSLPNTGISFRFIQDGEIRLDLPKGQTLPERFVKAMELREDTRLFNLIENSSGEKNPDWSFKIVIGEPGVYRNNKKNIYIFVNGRRIQEYSLAQAIEYGSQGYFPNGTFPVAAAFITVNPSLVDFNIHPAKKEARFKDISSLHHGISTAVKKFFSDYTNRTMKAQAEKIKKISETFLFEPEKLAAKALEQSESENRTGMETTGRTPYESEASHFGVRSRFFGGTSSTRSMMTRETPLNSWTGYASKNASYEKKSLFEEPEQKFNAVNENKAPEILEKKEKMQEIIGFMDKAISAYSGNTKKTPEIPAPEIQNEEKPLTETRQKDDFHFIGSALGTFLIAEKNNTLYIIDKHAAHERMLFDQIMKNPESAQTLLIPYVIETASKKDDEYLESIKNELKKVGFTCENKGNGRWEFTTLHERWNGTEEELYHALLDIKANPKDLIYTVAASTACRAAVKDGTILEDSAAEKIARGALRLDDPHCPHGRPCYTTITRENLFHLVRRTE